MGQNWGDDPPVWPAETFPGLRWRWRRWRAAHYVWAAMNAWMANPTPITRDAYQRALNYQDHVWTGRP